MKIDFSKLTQKTAARQLRNARVRAAHSGGPIPSKQELKQTLPRGEAARGGDKYNYDGYLQDAMNSPAKSISRRMLQAGQPSSFLGTLGKTERPAAGSPGRPLNALVQPQPPVIPGQAAVERLRPYVSPLLALLSRARQAIKSPVGKALTPAATAMGALGANKALGDPLGSAMGGIGSLFGLSETSGPLGIGQDDFGKQAGLPSFLGGKQAARPIPPRNQFVRPTIVQPPGAKPPVVAPPPGMRRPMGLAKSLGVLGTAGMVGAGAGAVSGIGHLAQKGQISGGSFLGAAKDSLLNYIDPNPYRRYQQLLEQNKRTGGTDPSVQASLQAVVKQLQEQGINVNDPSGKAATPAAGKLPSFFTPGTDGFYTDQQLSDMDRYASQQERIREIHRRLAGGGGGFSGIRSTNPYFQTPPRMTPQAPIANK